MVNLYSVSSLPGSQWDIKRGDQWYALLDSDFAVARELEKALFLADVYREAYKCFSSRANEAEASLRATRQDLQAANDEIASLRKSLAAQAAKHAEAKGNG